MSSLGDRLHALARASLAELEPAVRRTVRVLLADELRVTTTHVGIFAAVAAVVGMIGNVWWGRLADRRSTLSALRGVYVVGILTPLIYFSACTPCFSPPRHR